MTKHIKIHENEIYEEDVPDINNLIMQLSPDDGKPISWDIVENVMKNGTAFVLRDHSPEALKEKPKGRVIGKAVLIHNQRFTKFYGIIDDVVVHEEYRGKGLGKLLTNAMIKKAKELGMKHIDLTSRPHRVAAHKIYEKAGFQKRDTNVYRLKL